ncbi:MAG TPA: helix-turn-helix transcriptional regulator [Longilinea sp.]|nr:helix-turn-helix transcriptional regulator [Longilinea sp.]
MNTLAKLKALKRIEIEVLFWMCQGLTNDQIAEKLDRPNKTIESRISRVYEKLEVPGQGADKRGAVMAIYCETLGGNVNEEMIRKWVPEPVNGGEDQRIQAIERIYPDPDDIVSSPPGGSPPPLTRPEIYISQGDAHRRLRRWVLPLVVIILGLLAIIYFLLFRNRTPQIPLISPSDTPEIIPTADSGVLNTAVALTLSAMPSLTPAASNTSEPTFTATTPPTATSTFTATPTETPTPTWVPAGTVLFEDNFTNGLSDGWTVLYGKPSLANEQLTGDGPLWITVGKGWENYQIDMDVYPRNALAQISQPCQLIPRFTSQESYIAIKVIISTHGTYWVETTDGKTWREIANSKGDNFYSFREQHLTMRVEGDKYSFELDGRKISSIFSDQYPRGGFGMWIDDNFIVDNVKIVALP